MLTQPLLDNLSKLRLSGFRTALEEQLRNPQYAELSFEERLGLLVDVETTRRANNSLQRRIRAARFPIVATIEDLDLSARRGLNRAQVLQLTQSEWVSRHLNLLVLGATGAGKTYLPEFGITKKEGEHLYHGYNVFIRNTTHSKGAHHEFSRTVLRCR